MLSVLHAPVRRCVLVLGGAPPATSVYFVWDAVENADSYTLQLSQDGGSSWTMVYVVGLVLSHSLPLAAGTYHWRRLAYDGASVLDTTATLAVTVA